MRATVAQKRDKWGVRIFSGAQQKWRTVGKGEEGRVEAELIAAEINRQAEAEQLRAEGFLGLIPHASPIPTGEACRRWLVAYGPKLSKGTSQTWQGNIERHLVPGLGATDLRTLTEAQLIGFADQCYREKGLAPGTVANCLSILRRVVHVALQDGVLKQPPPAFSKRGKSIVEVAKEVFRSHGISSRKNAPRQRNPWTREEAERLLELAEKHEPSIFEVCATAYYTGARKGEILERLFARRRREQPWTFLSPEGKRWQESNFYHRPWKRLIKRAQAEGIRPFDFHSFRHTFIVLSRQAGRSPKAVSDIAGHRLDTLLKHYNRWVPHDWDFTYLGAASMPSRAARRNGHGPG